MKRSNKINHLIRTTCLVGALFCYSAAGYAAVMSNTTLPTGGSVVAGSGTIGSDGSNYVMNITGLDNTVIRWDSFDIGSIATVNFSGGDSFNVLNYVNGGNMSQIHGTLNAQGGNVYLVNPAGVFIGKSAQIDVGSLYVSNKKIEALDNWTKEQGTLNTTVAAMMAEARTPQTAAELMSLGHINATGDLGVTFDGGRIVLDTEYVTQDTDVKIDSAKLKVVTTDKEEVVLGYDGYDSNVGAYRDTGDERYFTVTSVAADGTKNENDSVKGYMWVENVEQLQKMNTNLNGNYALRNGIDATNTAENAFKAIGTDLYPFTGKLDGLGGRVEGVDFSVFDLHVSGNDNVGLFGSTDGATLKNLTFVSGSATGKDNVGMLAGSATNTTIENVTTSADVSGTTNVGGLVGSMRGGSISGLDAADPLLNTGAVTGKTNVGGIIGSMRGGTVKNARNIGQISGNDSGGISSNIGGIVGSMTDGATLSGVTNTLNVSGGYNVGGIAGSMNASEITEATNTADITANGYDTEEYYYHTAVGGVQITNQTVQVANAGGIAGKVEGVSKLDSVTNDGGNVQSSKVAGEEYYAAGNVGGIAGKVGGSTDANVNDNIIITNAINKENTVYGAHNVGGIAGYLEDAKISSATNNGGDIMGTGARNGNSFVTERIRSDQNETFNIGNMGGIVGLMYGENAYVSQAGNRGSVHSQFIKEGTAVADIPEAAKAANVGGIVGKIDRSANGTLTERLNAAKGNSDSAGVNDSYNTGEVQGYTGVGGIAGLMYNGEIVGSYNLGKLQSTRASATTGNNVQDALNMGGIVGDTTEGSGASAVLYDVYNTGVIGDEKFDFFGRHIGGIVGRLSGTVEKAYNTGAIYNGYNVVGGIAGYMDAGNIKDSFNTGNITVFNQNDSTSQVGGIVGSLDLSGDAKTIENVYNLGTIRSFRTGDRWYYTTNGAQYITNYNTVGGIVGSLVNWGSAQNLTIRNAYTLGNLYAGTRANSNDDYASDTNAYVGATYGRNESSSTDLTINRVYYITPELSVFTDLSSNNNANYNLNRANYINYNYRRIEDSYTSNNNSDENFSFSENGSNGEYIDTNSPWRIYEGSTTPILNAFLPKASKFFNDLADGTDHSTNRNNIASLQYGTAYNPMLTIINADKNNGDATITLDWATMGVTKGASFAVYGGNLTITNFDNSGNYFGGTLYADGALTISNDSGDIMLGSGAQVYGSSVDITSGGELISYGAIQSTGASAGENSGDVSLQADEDVEIIGAVKSAAAGDKVEVYGVDGTADVSDATEKTALDTQVTTNIANPNADMPDVAQYYGVTASAAADVKGDVAITSKKGDVDVLFGVAEKGYVQSAGSISLTGNSVYVDSDLAFGSALTLNSNDSVLDITNIGTVEATTNGASDDTVKLKAMHEFLTNAEGKVAFKDASGQETTDYIIAVDMWDDATSKFDLKKYNYAEDGYTEDTFFNALKTAFGGTSKVHIWLDNADQLQGINTYYTESKNIVEESANGILGLNFALKNDINATDLKNFHGIGYGLGTNNTTETDSFNVAFTGNMDGRGYSIIGLNVTADASKDSNFDYVGLFSRIGEGGSVKDLSIISSDFTGSSVGAVAGRNEGTIENVTTFGNRVTSDDSVLTNVFGNGRHYVGAAGGVTGINQGTIENVTSSDAVIAGIAGKKPSGEINPDNNDELLKVVDSTAGGIAGVNMAAINDSVANSAVTSNAGNANALGGVVGINYGKDAKVDVVESLGIVNGSYRVDPDTIHATENIGGIAGVNYNGASIRNAYNEAHISGSNAVGGVVGYSGGDTNVTNTINTISNVVNAGIVISSSVGVKDANGNKLDATRNTGGIVGNSQDSDISNARNTGAISGETNVGGMVGTNAENSKLKNVTNDGSATIEGTTNVGGIAGVNQGTINADEQGLVNKGTIHGQNTVGGIAGLNQGTIANTNSDITLYVKDTTQDAMYFGGVAGRNEGTITGATNTGDVVAEGASYVGGITGVNGKSQDGGSFIAGAAKITGAGNANSGKVVGSNYVGGVIGLNVGSVSGSDVDGTTTIRNDGYVHATAGGAGGIIGDNRADMDNVSLINGGIVYGEGTSGTGGVIGVNYGNIAKSDVIGEVGAVVIGSSNVGGLIGTNYGAVSGGRDTLENGGNYYAHQVYNNGTVVGGTYTEDSTATTNVVKDADDNVIGYYSVTTGSSNIGGVIGNNAEDDTKPNSIKSGSLFAAYNTGTVVGGTNVGGVVGNNVYVVNQVFNAGKVEGTGVNNVVGALGIEKGVVNDAYDMQTGAVGIISGDADIWKTYGDGDDYGTNKLLKVFLTKLEFNPVKDFDYSLIYNAKEQGFEVQKETDGTFGVYTVGRENNVKVGTLTSAAGAHSLKDYENSSSLLTTNSKTAVGQNYALFNTQQIATSTDNPNNLGFDFGTFNIDTANLVITLDAVERTYGDDTLTNKNMSTDDNHVFIGDGGSDNNKYGFVIDVADSGVIKGELNDAMLAALLGLNGAATILYAGSIAKANDGAIKDTSGNRKTNDASNYEWSTSFELGLNSSYKLVKNETDADGKVTTMLVDRLIANDVKGESVVKKADLVININDATTTYGTAFDENKYGYTFGTNGSNGLVNGDNQTDKEAAIKDIINSAAGGYNNSAAISDASNPNRVTADAGTHTDVVSFVNDKQDIDNALGNYNVITVNNGDAVVDRATLTVSDLLAKITYGDKVSDWKEELTNKGKLNGFVNGDNSGSVTLSYDTVTATGDYETNRGTRYTADAGTYENSLTVSGLKLSGDKAGNYKLADNITGDIKVDKAQLTINVNDATTTYGTAFDEKKYGYTLGENGSNGLVNGDTSDIIGALEYSNSAAKDGSNGVVTADAGKYADAVGITTNLADTLKNYEVTINKGDAEVTKAKLTIMVDNKEMTAGGSKPSYSGSLSGLVNGDNTGTIGFGGYDLDSSVNTNEADTYTDEIGVLIGGKLFLTGGDDILQNYKVTIDPGTLTVKAATGPDPTPTPDTTPGKNLWEAEDKYPWYQWDKQRNERERKAEVHFVDGGMAIH